MPGIVTAMNWPASKSTGRSSSISSAITSWVSARAPATTPEELAAGQAPESIAYTKLATSAVTSPAAAHWHIRNSPAPLRYLRPGASGQPSSSRPSTSRALQVPQVPVPHSYGRSTRARRPAKRIFSPGSASNS